jgi:hypothetical protein
MRIQQLVTAVITIAFSLSASAEEPDLNSEKGIRIKKGNTDLVIYADNKMSPNKEDWRKLNHRVYFRLVNIPPVQFEGRSHVMITIPGNNRELSQEEKKMKSEGMFPLSGYSISAKDFDRNFWVDSITLANTELETEYFQYENSPFIGTLTAPFKLRMAVGSSEESFMDGTFNVSQYFGWKFRISNSNPYFVSPFVFGGVTSLSYSSANNKGIVDATQKENGSGLTYGAGVAFRFGTISPGIVIGFDHGFGDLGRTFEYNDKLWLSFSLNFEFFKPKEAESDARFPKLNKMRKV